jgi:transcriptional regulator with XRE-family HTH domain
MTQSTNPLGQYLLGEITRRGGYARTAREVGLSDTLLRQIVEGRWNGRDTTLAKLAEGLGVPADELFKKAGRLMPYHDTRVPSGDFETVITRRLEAVEEAVRELTVEVRQSLPRPKPRRAQNGGR